MTGDTVKPCGKCWRCKEARGCIRTIAISSAATPTRNQSRKKS